MNESLKHQRMKQYPERLPPPRATASGLGGAGARARSAKRGRRGAALFLILSPLHNELPARAETIAPTAEKEPGEVPRDAGVPPGQTLAAPAASGPPPALRSPVPGFVIGGAGVASLIAGGVLIGFAESARADLETGPKQANGSPLCTKAAPTGPDLSAACAGLRSLASERSVMGNAGIGFLAVGGLAVAGAAAYLLWPQASVAPPYTSKLVPMVGPNNAGLLWLGAF